MSNQQLSIKETTHNTLRELSEQTGQSINEVLDQALDQYRRKLFFEGLTADYAALKADPVAWAEELAERQKLEGTLMDGLDPDERWTEEGRCLNPEPPSKESA